MIKIIISSFFFFSSFLFAHSQDVSPNIEKVKKIVEEGKRELGILYLDDLIRSNEIQDVDKIHYMITKLSFVSFYEDKESQDCIIKQINSLVESNYLCYLELKYSYDLKYLCD